MYFRRHYHLSVTFILWFISLGCVAIPSWGSPASVSTKKQVAIDGMIAEVSAKVSAHAKPEAFDSLLAELDRLAGAMDMKGTPAENRIREIRGFVTRWQVYLHGLESGDLELVDRTLSELIFLSVREPIVSRSELIALKANLSELSPTLSAVALARVFALKTKIETTLESAGTVSDFDALLAELGTEQASSGNYETGHPISQLRTLRRYVFCWRDYFGAMEQGNDAGAQFLLRNLSEDAEVAGLFPRSSLLRRLYGSRGAPLVESAGLVPLLKPGALDKDSLATFIHQLEARSAFFAQTLFPKELADVAVEATRLQAAAGQLAMGNFYPAMNLAKLKPQVSLAGEYASPLSLIRADLEARGLSLKQGAGIQDTDEAGEAAKRVHTTHFKPGDTDYLGRGSTRFTEKNFTGAKSDFDELLRKDPDDTSALQWRAKTRRELRDYAGAEEDYSHLLRLQPTWAYAYAGRGRVRFCLGNYREAMADFDWALALYPDEDEALCFRGITREILDDHVGAVLDLTNGLRLSPGDADQYSYRALAYLSLGNEDMALLDAEKGVELSPASPSSYYCRGLVKEGRGWLKAALWDFNKAISLDPHCFKAYRGRAKVLDALGDIQAKLATYDALIKAEPACEAAYIDRAVIGMTEGRYAQALEDLSKAVLLNGDDLNVAFVARGQANYGLGNLVAAQADFLLAAQLRPESRVVRFFRGNFRQLTGDFEGALEDYAFAAKEGDVSALFHQLLILRRLHRDETSLREKLVFGDGADVWMACIAAYLLGSMDDSTFFAKAGKGTKSQIREQACEALYFAGMSHLVRGDKATARTFLERCVATKRSGLSGYDFANAELKRSFQWAPPCVWFFSDPLT